MKWGSDRPEPMSLWEEDGDLQRMQTFFHTIETQSEGRERIKESIKQKALEKMARADESEPLPLNSPAGLGQRSWRGLRAYIGGFRWKLGVSVVSIAVLVIIGQGAMNASWSIIPRMGNSVNSTQNMAIAPQTPKSTSTQADSMADYGAIDGGTSVREGVNQKAAALNTPEASPSKKDLSILPVPPDQVVVPPADPGIPRKIIHDLSLTLEVRSINDSVTLISEEVQKLQGYVVSAQQSGLDSHSSGQLTVKIPADRLSALRDKLSAWGKVLDQQLVTNDITNQYYDFQSRIQVLEAEEKRYLEILNQAKTVDDVLKVENALGNVRQEIEHLKGQLKVWNNQVDYSTVTLQLVTQQSPNINVQNPWQPISWNETWKAARDAVLKTLSSTWNGLNYLVVGIGYASPYLLICALGWSLYRIWKKWKA